MNTYFYAVDLNGEYLFDNFPKELAGIISDFDKTSNPFEVIINGNKQFAKIGRKSNNYGTIYTLTTENKFIKRPKLFKELLEMSVLSLGPLSKFHNEIITSQTQKTEQFIHNVVSLNSYSIQELFGLIPHRTLIGNINKQKDIIKSIILDKPGQAVSTLLKLIKYNYATKVEFSVFERTQKPHAVINKIPHSIRSIVLSVLQIFIEDFEKHYIEVSLDAGEASERMIDVDYDSLFVSLFYILDNSVKYCCPHTKYKIIFKEEKNCFSVLFIMISIRIQPSEINKLTEFGYRSDIAKQLNADGKGIGMYRIVRTLKLNNAELEITPRVNEFSKTVSSIVYEGNQFKIKFVGQQNWFKT